MKISSPDPLDDNSPCPIKGKHFGAPMGAVPSHFLDWFLGQQHLMAKYPLVRDYAIKNQKYFNFPEEPEKIDYREKRMASYDPDYDSDSGYEDLR